MYKIIISPRANKNLLEINDYISLDNTIIAGKVIDNIFNTLSYISMFPLLGKELKYGFREIVEPNYKYRIIYRLKDKKIEVEIIAIFKNKNLF